MQDTESLVLRLIIIPRRLTNGETCGITPHIFGTECVSPLCLAARFEDPVGRALPPASDYFCDSWKRTEDLVYGQPAVPMYLIDMAKGERRAHNNQFA